MLPGRAYNSLAARNDWPNSAVQVGQAVSAADPYLDVVRQQWFEQACARISPQRVKALIVELVNHHSPTGAEGELCAFLAKHLTAAGFEARYDRIGEQSGNCVARRRGDGSGPDLLLYAPVDTHMDADPAIDIPWAGPRLRPDMIPYATIDNGAVIGLGAANPKSMVAAVVEAARCVLEAEVPLAGDAILAFCGGGMPWLPQTRAGAGLNSGVRHLLAQGVTADCGVILKTWDDIYHEHPGLVWFRVDVRGSLGYAGLRGEPDFRNSVVPAARLTLELERWLIGYADRHQSGQIRPEGAISAVHGGWTDRPAFPSATTCIYLDVRTNPDQSTMDIQREFGALISELRPRFRDVQIGWEMIGASPGARVDPDHWIVRAAERAWVETHGQPYAGATPMSGQSDAAALCRGGIPLVRIGFPFGKDASTPEELRDGLGGMGVARAEELTTAIRQLVHIVIDTCTRSRDEICLATEANSERTPE